ncbi:MAG TPA: pro-sigmaK processing inhibitor BofA family protein [Methanoregulaceae archaeon]|nr:pro-sigmaK processing inhibitor BofA family protein [Methanoregulaceae archaeon]HPD75322.1 pro-sigmaK processing inhibitor BofA family protein [Methanoregulaceae archaeon]
MSDILITIALVIVVIVIGYYLAKRMAVLLANAVLGLILLFLINFFHIMSWLGRGDLGYSIPTLLISAIGGVPGVAILMLLSIFGITV